MSRCGDCGDTGVLELGGLYCFCPAGQTREGFRAGDRVCVKSAFGYRKGTVVRRVDDETLEIILDGDARAYAMSLDRVTDKLAE